MKVVLFIKNFLNSWVMLYPQSFSTNSTDALATINTTKLIQLICTKLLYVLGMELCTLHNYIFIIHGGPTVHRALYQYLSRYCIRQQLTSSYRKEACVQEATQVAYGHTWKLGCQGSNTGWSKFECHYLSED